MGHRGETQRFDLINVLSELIMSVPCYFAFELMRDGFLLLDLRLLTRKMQLHLQVAWEMLVYADCQASLIAFPAGWLQSNHL